MTYQGRVQDGVIVLEGRRRLPEGALVSIKERTSVRGIKKSAEKASKNGEHAITRSASARRQKVMKRKSRMTHAELLRFAQKNPPPASWFEEPPCDLTKPE